MSYQVQILRATRKNILGLTKDLSIEQLNYIPPKFNNNLIWNMGHVVVTQQLLCYRLSGLPSTVANEMIERYRKGSRPEGVIEAEEIALIRQLMLSTVDDMEADLTNGLFKEYKTYGTSYGIELSTTEDAIVFNNSHEAMHLGTCLALKKMLG